jgi:hypothetical protein
LPAWRPAREADPPPVAAGLAQVNNVSADFFGPTKIVRPGPSHLKPRTRIEMSCVWRALLNSNYGWLKGSSVAAAPLSLGRYYGLQIADLSLYSLRFRYNSI